MSDDGIRIHYYAYNKRKDVFEHRDNTVLGYEQPLIAVYFLESVPIRSNICGKHTSQRDWFEGEHGK